MAFHQTSLDRNNAEEALQKLNGTVIGKQTVRLSWGRNPANKQVYILSLSFPSHLIPIIFFTTLAFLMGQACPGPIALHQQTQYLV